MIAVAAPTAQYGVRELSRSVGKGARGPMVCDQACNTDQEGDRSDDDHQIIVAPS